MTTKAETVLGGVVSGASTLGVSFHCYRCGKVLTDPASTQAGIGPECRQLANSALAVCIPANLPAALAALEGVTLLGHIDPALVAVREELADTDRTDWRAVANVLVRLIAYGAFSAKDALCNAVEALGYGVLANVARKHASPAKATVTVEGARLVLKAVKNLPAVSALKLVPGRQYHPLGKTWSVPVTELKALCAVVASFYPLSGLNVLALAVECAKAIKVLEEAKAAKAAEIALSPAPVAPPVAKAAPAVTVTATPSGFEIVSPYNGKFVADLKVSLPYPDRKWTGSSWWVSKKGFETAKVLVSKHYGIEVAVAA